MKTISVIAFAALVLATGGTALAQTCKPFQILSAGLNLDVLKLYDTNGSPQGRVAKSDLPSQLAATDCGDATYVMIEVQNSSYLVRKSDLRMPKVDAGCICLSSSKAQPSLGTPGVAGPRYCPAAQCPGR